MASFPYLLSQSSQDGVIALYRQCTEQMDQQYNLRSMMEMRDRQYIREIDQTKDETRARIRNLYQQDPTKFRNVTIPVVMPQVESAVAYQASVFLTGVPIFGVVSAPQYIDQALAMEALIADQSIRGAWARNFMLAFRDGFKYNLFGLEVTWEAITTPAFETNLGKNGAVREVTWEGNVIKRKDPYNLIWDTRYIPAEVHSRGEFAGYTDIMSRIEFKKYVDSLPSKQIQNVRAAFESQWGGGTVNSTYSGYYIPPLNPDALVENDSYLKTTNWLAWAGIAQRAGSRIQYSNIYERSVLYVRILPSDLNMRVPQPNTPQIWKFVIINQSVVLVAERLTNAHDNLPMIFGQPSEHGLGYQDKSIADNAIPYQNVASALMNANIAARRRAVSDRALFDPSRVTEAKINSDNPSAKIPCRPSAYGTPMSEAVYSFPFRDDQSANNVNEMQLIMQLADYSNGQNRAKQGQFTKGNRTKFEFQDIMGNANARDQMTAILIEEQTMTPIKEIIKLNILQYQPQTTLLDKDKSRLVEVDPVKLRQAVMNFKVSDGLIPSEKIIGGEEFAVALQAIGSSPQITAAYNIAPMFSYLMKTRGADLTPFEKPPEQIAYEQAVAAWQNTVQMLFKQNPDIKEEQLPKQPVPADFNYVPAQYANTQTN